MGVLPEVWVGKEDSMKFPNKRQRDEAVILAKHMLSIIGKGVEVKPTQQQLQETAEALVDEIINDIQQMGFAIMPDIDQY